MYNLPYICILFEKISKQPLEKGHSVGEDVEPGGGVVGLSTPQHSETLNIWGWIEVLTEPITN